MNIDLLLKQSSSRHTHLCPRQILGVRIGLLGVSFFGLVPGTNVEKRLLCIIESDGCFLDGIEVASGCTPGHRTLRIEDYGKIAAVFVDTHTKQAIRIAPRLDVRERAADCFPDEPDRYSTQMMGYKDLPDEELLSIQSVTMNNSLEKILSTPGLRVQCTICGEDIINEREVQYHGAPSCKTCAGQGFYHPI